MDLILKISKYKNKKSVFLAFPIQTICQSDNIIADGKKMLVNVKRNNRKEKQLNLNEIPSLGLTTTFQKAGREGTKLNHPTRWQIVTFLKNK